MPRRAPAVVLALALLAAAGTARAQQPSPPPPRLALALSGGGARGFAHIGVLEALEECGLAPDAIAGTSMGALVGGMYALGYTPAELEEVALRPDWSDIFLGVAGGKREHALLRQEDEWWPLASIDADARGLRVPAGLVPAERLGDLLAFLVLRAAGTTDFSALRLPFRAVATDLETGKRVVLDHGSLPQAMRASMAVPAVFSPAEIDGRLLVDGGLVSNLPVDVARGLGADVVVAVDVSSPLRERDRLRDFIDILDQSISFAIARGVSASRAEADLVIAPDLAPGTAAAFERGPARDLIACGREAGAAACAAIHRLLEAAGGRPPATREPRPRSEAVTARSLEVSGGTPAAGRIARRLFGPLPEDGSLPLDELEGRVARVRASEAFREVAVADVSGGTVRLHVTEPAPLHLRLGASYDDKHEALGRAALTWRTGGELVRELGADVTFGEVVRALVEARHTRRLHRPLRLVLRGEWRDELDRLVIERDDLGRLRFERLGGEARADVSLATSTLASIGYRIQRVEGELDGDEPPPHEIAGLGRETHGSVLLRLAADTTDRYHSPTRGALADARLVVASTALGGDVDFTRVAATAAAYHTVGRATLFARLRGSARLGGDLPLPEQAVGGGNEPFPGYARDEFRGDHLASAEAGARILVFELPGAIGRGLVAGAQAGAGSVWDGPGELSARGRLLGGVALLAAIETRFGPIELLYGFGRDDRRKVTLQVGPRLAWDWW